MAPVVDIVSVMEEGIPGFYTVGAGIPVPKVLVSKNDDSFVSSEGAGEVVSRILNGQTAQLESSCVTNAHRSSSHLGLIISGLELWRIRRHSV